jgi:RimJ/RimL family protein N-acetyltransferase
MLPVGRESMRGGKLAAIFTTMAEIETARLRLRMFTPRDLDDLMLIFGDPDVMKYLGIEAGTTLTREEVEVTLEKMIEFWSNHGFGRWAVINKEDEKMIGLCGLRLLDGAPELVYAIAKAYWGRGLATEAARASLRYAFEALQLERIVAVTRHANTASIRVMRKIGMSYENEVNHYGVDGVCYVANRDEFQIDDSTYILSRA